MGWCLYCDHYWVQLIGPYLACVCGRCHYDSHNGALCLDLGYINESIGWQLGARKKIVVRL